MSDSKYNKKIYSSLLKESVCGNKIPYTPLYYKFSFSWKMPNFPILSSIELILSCHRIGNSNSVKLTRISDVDYVLHRGEEQMLSS